MGFHVADPLGRDEALAGAGAGAGVQEGGVRADEGGVGEVDKGDQGGCVCGVEDGKEGVGGVVCLVDGEIGAIAKPLIRCLQWASNQSLASVTGSTIAWLGPCANSLALESGWGAYSTAQDDGNKA